MVLAAAVRRLAWLAGLLATAGLAVAQPVPARHVLQHAVIGDWTISVDAPTNGVGLQGAVLTAVRDGRAAQVPLDTTPTGRTARAIDAVRLHVPSGRLLVLTDQAHDAPGVLVIDLPTGRLVTAALGRHMTPSPDARFIAFEEYFSRVDTPWPWNETAYAVLDVTQSAPAPARPCPFEDDRCRGVPVHLPSRHLVCASYRARTGAPTCLRPGQPPQHERRSPFVWLDAHTLAFVSVDRQREETAIVTASFGEAGTATVTAVGCPDTPDARGARCPTARVAWQVDVIRRDDEDGRLWIHFRDRVPEVPGGWLALR